MPNSFSTSPIDLDEDAATSSISLAELLGRLGERTPDFLSGVQQEVHAYIAGQGRRVCLSIVETDGRGNGRPRTHILDSDSLPTFVNVFQCFIRNKPYKAMRSTPGCRSLLPE